MGPEDQSSAEGRVRRASAVVRAWDGPNSRIAFEMDLDQMPWGPFEALGKRVTLLVPARVDENGAPDEGFVSHLEQALRHVEHAAEKCAEFADPDNENDPWRASLETWEWLRDYLTSAWVGRERETEEAEAPQPPAQPEGGPDMPGAAATLEVAARALRQTPLAVWREAVGAFNPAAPTREEAIQTLLGVARVLAHAREGDGAALPEAPAPPSPGDEEAAAEPSSGTAHPEESPSAEAGREEPGTDTSPAPARDPDELSFDYASGYDEGYRMGRRVGRALAARDRVDPSP